MNTVNADAIASKESLQYSIPCRTIGSFQGSMDLLTENLSAWKSGKSRVLLLSGTRGRGERLRDSLSENGIESVYMDSVSEPVMPGQVVITRGSLHKGFEYPTSGFVVISDDEIFGLNRKTQPQKPQQIQRTPHQPLPI